MIAENMFKALVKALKSGDTRNIAKVVLDYANAEQVDTLVAKLPDYYNQSISGRVTVKRVKPEATISKRTLEMMDKSIKGIKVAKADGTETASYTVVLGGYGHEAAAQRECQQFRHHNVFIYQSAIFPEPRTHGVEVKVTSAKPVKLEQPSSPLYPWGVELTLAVAGPSAKVTHWLNGFQARTRMQVAR